MNTHSLVTAACRAGSCCIMHFPLCFFLPSLLPESWFSEVILLGSFILQRSILCVCAHVHSLDCLRYITEGAIGEEHYHGYYVA